MSRMPFTVALVGPDGTGKTTVSRRLAAVLPFEVRTIYMGINPETSRLMLPTTRLLLSLRRARGNPTHLVASSDPERALPPARSGLVGRLFRDVKSGLGLVNWLAEEWFRQGMASYHRARGRVVVFDRHFVADYYHYDVAPQSHATRHVVRRAHGLHLARLYPKPDLVICLDAPAEVIAARKGEAPVEWLEKRRRQYLEMGDLFPKFAVVDATAPLEQVVDDVARVILDFARLGERDGDPTRSAPTAT